MAEDPIRELYAKLRAVASEGICPHCGGRLQPIEGLPGGVHGGACPQHGSWATDRASGEVRFTSLPGSVVDWADRG